MDCRQTQSLIDSCLDGELELTSHLEIERHVADCPTCRAIFENRRALSGAIRAHATYYAAPTAVAARVRAALNQAVEPPPATFRPSPRWLSLAASVAFAAFLGAGVTYWVAQPSPDELLAREAVAGHVRSLMVAGRSTDVSSSDQHTVKPWFNGKLDFRRRCWISPAKAFTLVGGRLDYLDQSSGRGTGVSPPAACDQSVYLAGGHNSADATAADPVPSGIPRIALDSEAGMNYWAVSDLNPADLQTFGALVQRKRLRAKSRLKLPLRFPRRARAGTLCPVRVLEWHRSFGARHLKEKTMNAPIPDLAALKTRLKGVWSAGDFGQIARSYEAGAAEFVADLDIARGMRVLDVACGTGNLALPAARPRHGDRCGHRANLVQQARERAAAEGVRAQFDEGDAEELPYKEGSFDLVLSMFGAMFCPRPERVAAELIRVCRRRGASSWPIGCRPASSARYSRRPARTCRRRRACPRRSPGATRRRRRADFHDGIADIRCKRRAMTFAFPFTPPEVVEHWRQYYGPPKGLPAALDEKGQGALRRSDLEALWTAHNRATDGSTRVESSISRWPRPTQG